MRIKISLGIILILGVILLIIGKITIQEQRNRMMTQMNTYGTETAGFIAQISIIPIQKYSIYQLENYVAQLEKGQLISYCEIYDNSDSPLAHSTKNRHTPSGDDAKKPEVLIFNADIVDNHITLGRVELGINITPFIARINATSLYISIAFLFELLLIGLAVSFFIHKSLVSPIVRLSDTTRKLASGLFVTSDQATRTDEIGGLAKSLNDMSLHLQESYRTLELKVEERTAELSAAKNAAERMNRHLAIVGAEVQALLDNSPVGIIFVSINRVIQRVNLEFSRITGYGPSELIGESTRTLYLNQAEYDEAEKITYTILQREGICQATLQLRKKDGQAIMCSMRGRLTILDSGAKGVVWSLEDITSRLKMEEELLKIKKLESVGVLAGGIAHDFNNILVAIIGNISLAERLVESSPKVTELLLAAKKASLRAKDLTIKLLTYAKGGEQMQSVEQLPEIIKDSSSFVLSGSNVKCSYDFDEDLWAVRMDKGQINQVIQNIILNADQSMPEGGLITLKCRNTQLAELEIPGLSSGQYVCLTITDTGAGIDPSHIDKVFDPYFSTKEKDSNKGSGLGLSIVHSIVTKHGGTILVQSVPGQGSTFTLYLPATAESIIEPPAPATILPSGKGLVLVMDDEETIHNIIGEMLAYLGYESVHAYNGEEALDVYSDYQQSSRPIDAVIMDLTIPGGMGGAAAVKKLKALDPLARVIVSSGYSDDPILHNYRAAGFSNIISKPYQLLDLSKVMSETLR